MRPSENVQNSKKKKNKGHPFSINPSNMFTQPQKVLDHARLDTQLDIPYELGKVAS